jgi:hypothetical protein
MARAPRPAVPDLVIEAARVSMQSRFENDHIYYCINVYQRSLLSIPVRLADGGCHGQLQRH